MDDGVAVASGGEDTAQPQAPPDFDSSSLAAAAQLGRFGVWCAGHVATSAVQWAQWGTQKGFAFGRTAVEASGRFAETAILSVAAAAAAAESPDGDDGAELSAAPTSTESTAAEGGDVDPAAPGFAAMFREAVPHMLVGLEYGREAVVRTLHATERLAEKGIRFADSAISSSLSATDGAIARAAGSQALSDALRGMRVSLPRETLGALATVSAVVREFAGAGHDDVTVGPIDSAVGVVAVAAVQAATRPSLGAWLRSRGPSVAHASPEEVTRLVRLMRFASAAYGAHAMTFMGYRLPPLGGRQADSARGPTAEGAQGEGEAVNVIEIGSSEQLQTALVDAADADAEERVEREAHAMSAPEDTMSAPEDRDKPVVQADPPPHVLHHGAISHHARVPETDIRSSEWGGSLFRPVHYVAVDRAQQSVVVTLRGTMCAEDVLTDLVCRPVPYISRRGIQAIQGTASEGADATVGTPVGHVHEGFLRAAHRMDALLRPAVLELLAEHPGYRVVVVGHSLGAGVASLLTLLWADGGLPASAGVTCAAFATPCVASAELSRALKARVWSVVLENDFVCRLSLGSSCDLRRAVASVIGEPGLAWRIIRASAQQTVARMRSTSQSTGAPAATSAAADGVGLRPDASQGGPTGEQTHTDATPEFFASVRSALRADMQHAKLFPPGRVFWVRRIPTEPSADPADAEAVASLLRAAGADISRADHVIMETDCASFDELPLSGRVLLDHMPLAYEEAIERCAAPFAESAR